MPKVLKTHWYSENVFEIRLERGELPFQPGDCSLLIEKDGITARPYSISSSPSDDYLGFLIRRVPGGILTNYLAEVLPGEEVGISPFFGWFYPGTRKKEVYFATGTGISPFLSAARQGLSPPLALFYGAKNLDEAGEVDTLQQGTAFHLALSQNIGSNRDQEVYEELSPSFPLHSGRITELFDRIPLAQDIHYYLCGHEPMILDITAYLQDQGIDQKQISFEVFFS
jgi:benzoate/toluate 1,2-dioxygenase reductase subunit